MEYNFLTNTNGKNSAKSPIDMLPYRMENDLSKVIGLADNYYEN